MANSIPSCQVDRAALDWFARPASARLMTAEQQALIPALTGVHGHRALYLRPQREANAVLSGNLLGQVVALYSKPDGHGWDGDATLGCGDFSYPEEHFSLVYLLHTLDYCRTPQALLTDIARMLVPGGCLISVGLNPNSPASLSWRGKGPVARSARQVRRWLEHAGMQPHRLFRVGPSFSLDANIDDVSSADRPNAVAALRVGYAWFARKSAAALTLDPKRARDTRQTLLRGGKVAPHAG